MIDAVDAKAMTFLRLLGIYLRLGILNELQYRTNLFIQLIQSAVGLAPLQVEGAIMTLLVGLGIIFAWSLFTEPHATAASREV